MDILDFTVPSSDGIHTLAGHVYLPDGFPDTCPRGVFHVVHGMTEHIGRYDPFLRDICKTGWIVCGYDNLGHGHTVKDSSELGYIARKKGYELLARDVGLFSNAVQSTYNAADLPYILVGHSMGSFIVRFATAKGYVRPTRLVVMGTGGPNPIAGVGLGVIGAIKLLKGERHISPMIDKLAFGTYNARFGGVDKHSTDPTDHYQWLNTQKEPLEVYCADPLCAYQFTASGMGDLVRLTVKVNRGKWFKSLPSGMPVLLVSGKDDPVGDYGKGISKVRDGLDRRGVPVDMHLYEGYRHEILFDLCYPDVLGDISAFINSIEKE